MASAPASTYTEAELGSKAEQFLAGTLPALLRKSAVCQHTRFLDSSEGYGSGASPLPVPQHVTFSQEQRRQRPELLCSRAVLSGTDKFQQPRRWGTEACLQDLRETEFRPGWDTLKAAVFSF